VLQLALCLTAHKHNTFQKKEANLQVYLTNCYLMSLKELMTALLLIIKLALFICYFSQCSLLYIILSHASNQEDIKSIRISNVLLNLI
jgi:hypothetical protein